MEKKFPKLSNRTVLSNKRGKKTFSFYFLSNQTNKDRARNKEKEIEDYLQNSSTVVKVKIGRIELPQAACLDLAEGLSNQKVQECSNW